MTLILSWSRTSLKLKKLAQSIIKRSGCQFIDLNPAARELLETYLKSLGAKE